MNLVFKKNILEKINNLNKMSKNSKQVNFILSSGLINNHTLNKISNNIDNLKNLNNHLSYLIQEIDESLNKR